jgi:hypothetical protein
MFKRLLLCVGLLMLTSPAYSAVCVVTQYPNLLINRNNVPIPVALEPSLVTTAVTYTTSTGTAAFGASTTFVRIVCNAKAHYKFSTTGTNATASDPWLATDTPEYFGVPVGQSYLVEFYDGSS